MTDKEIDLYYKLSTEKLEIELQKLNKKRMDIVLQIENGTIESSKGKRAYRKINKLYCEVYEMFEKRLANEHTKMLLQAIK